MKLDIYNASGRKKLTVSTSSSSTWSKELMGEDVLSLSFVHSSYVELEVNDYALLGGVRFSAKKSYKPKQKNRQEYSYSLKLYAPIHDARQVMYLHLTDGEYTPQFSLDGTPGEHLAKWLENMNRIKGAPHWLAGDVLVAPRKTIEYNNTTCWDALGKIAEAFETEWWVDGGVINIGRCEHGEQVELGYHRGLTSLVQSEGGESVKFFTRLIPLGSTRNIDPTKYGFPRLQLPGREKYVERNTEYGLYEHVEETVFSEIFPNYTGTVSAVRAVQHKGNDGKDFTVYYFKDEGLPFDPNSHELPGKKKRVSFLTGDLGGHGTDENGTFYFEADYKTSSGEWEIITIYPDEKRQLPGGNLIPRVGDRYAPWNIRMPEEYILRAEQEYRAAVDDYLARFSEDIGRYGGETDYIYISEQGVKLDVGLRVRLISEEYFAATGGSRESRITKLVRKLDNLDMASIECCDRVGKSWRREVSTGLEEIRYVLEKQSAQPAIDVLKSWDGGEPTDYRLPTAKRVIQEIERKALSKEKSDYTPHHLGLHGGSVVDKSLLVRGSLAEDEEDVLAEETTDILVEEPPTTVAGSLGSLTNVDDAVDSAPKGSLLQKTDSGWVSIAPEAHEGETPSDVLMPVYDRESENYLFVPPITGFNEEEFNALAGKVDSLMKTISQGGIFNARNNLYIRNNLPSLGFSTQYGEPCLLNFTFISQYREEQDEPYKPTGETGMCTIMIRNARYADFTVVKQTEIPSGVNTQQDVSEWLTAGANQVKITIQGLNTDQTTAPVTYSVQLTSLGVNAPNFTWWTAFVSDITIPLMISGNIHKVLHLTLEGEEYSRSYTQTLGTSVYVDTPYNFSIEHPGVTGVFTLSFYLANQDNTIQTKTVTLNIMCVTAGSTRKLMCVNHVASHLTNWQDNRVFAYAVHHGQATQTAATLRVIRDNQLLYVSENDSIPTNAQNIFSYPMELETDDDTDFTVAVSAIDAQGMLVQPMEFRVDNSLGYAATSGASLYINPRTRSNSQTNARTIVNEVNKAEIPVEWTNMSWGNDGWVRDTDDIQALRIPAGSSAVIDYRPFAVEPARTGKTIELDFRVENATDAGHNIITMAENDLGLRVSGENVSLFSQSRRDSTTQDLPIDNGVRIRLAAVIMPNAYGNNNFNLVALYVNGRKNRQFTYESNDYFKHDGKIKLGNDHATLFLYGLRIYDRALTSEEIGKNYINQLAGTAEKEKETETNKVFDAEGVEIDFEATKRLYNVFVFDKPFPSLRNPSGVGGNLSVFFKDKPEMNFTVSDVLGEGQGTSSKKYLEWNLRFKFNSLKNSEGEKITSVVAYADGTTEKKAVRMFPGIPKAERLTAKKNWASSMQDHKAGAVASYNDLYKELELTNEAIKLNPEVRVAVYQEAFIGFSKSVNEEGKEVYTCMGEFTFGPDKGDKGCFGYDTKRFPEMISIEGSDNAPLGALFRVPWNRNKSYWQYNADEEAFQYNNTNCWDFNAGNLKDDESEPRSTQLWVDAYNTVYVCNPRIRPFLGTPAQLNAEVNTYRSTGYEYWIATPGEEQYNLYYYEAAEGRFIPSDIGDGIINLRAQLSAYLAEDLSVFGIDDLNKLFINARKRLFRDTVPAHFDIPDAIFHHNYTEFTAGTDQRAKNTYPYNFCLAGSKWKWRLDDADTIFPIDNQGQDRKPYWCEMHDFYENGQPMWNGETSVFWNMLEMAFEEEIAAGMRKMLQAMEKLSGQSSGTPYDKVYAFYKKYFLGIKEYFPATLVNSDAKRYEMAKLAYNNGTYTNDTDPITQSHGDFYSAETAWMKKRIMYIMSKYSYGLFSANGTDTIVVRAAGDLIDYDITPALDMYPAIANGTSIIRAERTKAGETRRITIDLGGSADQQNAIQGASWLLSIGDWHNKNVSGTMVVRGKRLRELLIGSKTEEVLISITSLTVADCGSVRKILLSNIGSLKGVLDVENCIDLRELYADGTGLSQIKLPNGSGLHKLEYPAENRYLTLRNFPLLATEGLRIAECAANISDFLVENCPLLKPLEILSDILTAQKEQGENRMLKRIRAIGFHQEYRTAESLDLLTHLADGSFHALTSEGLAAEESLPVLDGTVVLHGNYYTETVDAIRAAYSSLNLVLMGTPSLRFADPEVLRVLLNGKVGQYLEYTIDADGDGVITQEEVEALPTLTIRRDGSGSIFAGNTLIERFPEFRYFTSLTALNGTFQGCTALTEVTLPVGTTMYDAVFSGSGIVRVIVPEGYTAIGQRFCNGAMQCILIDLPSTLTTLGGGLTWATGNGKVTVVCRAEIPPEFGGFGYNAMPAALYVPDASVEAYREATNWKNAAAVIKPLSEYQPI